MCYFSGDKYLFIKWHVLQVDISGISKSKFNFYLWHILQVNVPGTPRSKVVPVVSLDGKEQLQLNLDSVSTVIPQIIQGSESSEALVTLPTAVSNHPVISASSKDLKCELRMI